MLESGNIWIEGYHSSNGGASWEYQPSDTFGAITAVSFCNETYGWMAGMLPAAPTYSTFMIHTVDGGNTWNKIEAPTNVEYIFGIQFLNPSFGRAIAHLSLSANSNVLLIYK